MKIGSSLSAPWQNSPYKNTKHSTKHAKQDITGILNKLFVLCLGGFIEHFYRLVTINYFHCGLKPVFRCSKSRETVFTIIAHNTEGTVLLFFKNRTFCLNNIHTGSWILVLRYFFFFSFHIHGQHTTSYWNKQKLWWTEPLYFYRSYDNMLKRFFALEIFVQLYEFLNNHID